MCICLFHRDIYQLSRPTWLSRVESFVMMTRRGTDVGHVMRSLFELPLAVFHHGSRILKCCTADDAYARRAAPCSTW